MKFDLFNINQGLPYSKTRRSEHASCPQFNINQGLPYSKTQHRF